MVFDKTKLRWLKELPVYRFLAIPRRILFSAKYLLADVPNWAKWIFASREESNFTYDLEDDNLLYLAHTLAFATGKSVQEARTYIEELRNDEQLGAQLLSSMRASAFRSVSDNRIGYARRLGWYALVRLIKPKVVIETGVDKGLGAMVLCAALLRNTQDGSPGRYYGTDIVPTAGWLLTAPYSSVGEILYGDSIESLTKLDAQIDLFINDSDHSADYEAREYETILPKLAKDGIIVADNAHVTPKLAEFSEKQNRKFLFFREEPRQHWYPGAGMGISLPSD